MFPHDTWYGFEVSMGKCKYWTMDHGLDWTVDWTVDRSRILQNLSTDTTNAVTLVF